MTDNDIIKVGECIKGEKVLCLSCPYRARFPDCRKYVIRDIFDLASRQKAELESCYEFIEQLKEARKIWDDKCKHQQAELEKLKDENYHLRGYSDSIVKRMQHLFKSETIRQFDEIDRRTYQYKKDVSKFDEEFKRYKEAFEKMPEEKVFSVDLSISSIKAEAVKECIEKIKTRSSSCVASKDGIVIAGSRTYTISEVKLYEIEKEMVGDTK